MNNAIFLFLVIFILFNEDNMKVNIKFNVRDEHNKAINGAIIIIKPCNIKCLIKKLTYCDGGAIFKNISTGSYKVIVYKEGYKIEKFIINPCKNSSCTICLYPCKHSKVYGYITNQCNEPVDKAVVVLYRVIGEKRYFPIQFTYTDYEGRYNFCDVPKDCYIIKSIK
ncbi:MAG: hypothetical protein RR636_05130 [Clostridium sp.]|uniref:hypothetical protein n=1 Tax=Clostridium sp. TaxID=1506 RepID=UPI0030235097